MPAWYATTREWVQQDKLVVLGVAQEQHPERCRLFAQWHQLPWPILHDPINVMQVKGVPIEVAIDEHGMVRSLRPQRETFEKEFFDRSFSSQIVGSQQQTEKPPRPDIAALRQRAQDSHAPIAWRELGDALVLWEGTNRIEEAILAYGRALHANSRDGAANFRLGVCYRMRYDSPQGELTDFQRAVDYWTKARDIEPNQYIWRRRIEQYGPRLTKPYPFYDWVERAAHDISARGERPVTLRVSPTGSELAAPDRDFGAEHRDAEPPDPHGRIVRDTESLILTEVTVVPPSMKSGQSVRIYLTFNPDVRQKAHWNNESEALKVWVDPPPGWQSEPQLLIAPQPEQPESSETRRLEFELRAPADAKGAANLAAYALYFVCEDEGGTCHYLRQDIPIRVTVDQ